MGEKIDVRIEVSNSGPAIDGATLVQLFEPLKRGTANDGILVWALACTSSAR